MRVHIYSTEQPGQIISTTKIAENGRNYFGVKMGFGENMVTVWCKSDDGERMRDLAQVLHLAGDLFDETASYVPEITLGSGEGEGKGKGAAEVINEDGEPAHPEMIPVPPENVGETDEF